MSSENSLAKKAATVFAQDCALMSSEQQWGSLRKKTATTSGSGATSKQTKKLNPKTPRLMLNPDYEIRLEIMNTKKEFIVERGIKLEELSGTPIPDVVRRRKWETYVSRPPPYNGVIVPDNIFEKNNIHFTNGLVAEPMIEWNSTTHAIHHSKLYNELAFWQLFFNRSLKPNKHVTTVAFDLTNALYSML
ncbi:hypothetical protein Ddye_011406 [Dipteronia dyeriana]|uniref:Uncharacterized protein n=1 Tax=Dipteronia dyeriana TaxID=168575 RepID=A0AAE0CGX1_9ROSI|nr:hypothetical protein Ddye_011406 [Dipteronia dyeriana]